MVVAEPQRATSRRTREALVDCDFHNEIDSIKDLYPYLSQHWRDHIDAFGTRGPTGGTYPRFMDHREDARPPSGPAQRLGGGLLPSGLPGPVQRGLRHAHPAHPGLRQLNLDLDAALATAVNDWQVSRVAGPGRAAAGVDGDPVRGPAGGGG